MIRLPFPGLVIAFTLAALLAALPCSDAMAQSAGQTSPARQTARVMSGEHADFTRLVIELPGAGGWTLGRTATGYAFASDDRVQPTYDLATVWDRIPRSRLQSLRTDPGSGVLLSSFACPCHDSVFAADTGFAGRVNFERLPFWAERDCVYWVAQAQANLPLRLQRGRWFLRSSASMILRLPRAELGPLVERWPLEGPQTWEQRKWRHIESNRLFAAPAARAESRLRA